MAGVKQSLGATLTTKVKTSRVLLVGAGGIGCELLKNLVCCGFGSISDASEAAPNGAQETVSVSDTTIARKGGIVVVDLDTIDLSNLNRQFLFRKQHIKKPKATVAKDTASQFNPAVHIEAHHASIFDSQYDVEFFESFDVVFNALDNVTARRHVNRMCLAANVPLIESGTTGFNGQVQAIKKDVTECYDCLEKPVQKSFPICTIRSTPTQPIHCIVWAKSYLLPELFGASEDDEEEGDTEMKVTEGDNAEELAKLKIEAQALKQIRNIMGQPGFAQEVFNKVFYEDIQRLCSMTEMWKTRKPPQALRFQSVCIDKNPEKHGEQLATQDQIIWSLLDNLKVFCYSLDVLSKRVAAGEKVIEFDKDDKDTLDLVASASNLRAHIFSIPTSSEWDIKQMAGNIIPAIATSNAITASLCVFEGFKILRHQLSRSSAFPPPTANNNLPTTNDTTTHEDRSLGGCKKVYLESKNTERLINSEALAPPRPDCPVCSPFYAKLILPVDGTAPTLGQLVDLLKSRISPYDEFTITVGSSIIYDPDLDDNLPKSLSELEITGESTQFVTVTDDSDEPKVDLVLSVQKKPLPIGEGMRLLPEAISLKEKVLPPKAKEEEAAGEAAGEKRKRDAEEDADAGSAKRAKVGAGEDGEKNGEVVMVEDDGPIALD